MCKTRSASAGSGVRRGRGGDLSDRVRVTSQYWPHFATFLPHQCQIHLATLMAQSPRTGGRSPRACEERQGLRPPGARSQALLLNARSTVMWVRKSLSSSVVFRSGRSTILSPVQTCRPAIPASLRIFGIRLFCCTACRVMCSRQGLLAYREGRVPCIRAQMRVIREPSRQSDASLSPSLCSRCWCEHAGKQYVFELLDGP